MSKESLGRVHCDLRGSVVAGSYETCTITYTAGFAGVDDTGSLKLVMRYATDSGTPQFDDPKAANYVTAVASNGAHLQLRYDVKDNTRPWGKTIHIKVLQGYLRKGETITVTLGDRSGGSHGWRMQTFAEKTFEIRVLVDRYATYVYEQLPKSPTFQVVAGEPVKFVAVAPSLVRPNKKITVRTKHEDRWGNPVGKPGKVQFPGLTEQRYHTLLVDDEVTGTTVRTNPILVSDKETYGRYWADIHGQSEETIGTNSIEDYFRFARDFGFVDICGHQGNDFQITDDFWEKIQATTKKFDRNGRFVAFPGWEWSGNTGLGGDRNVVYLDEGGFISRSSRALVADDESNDECSYSVEDLFERLNQSTIPVMLIPHVGGRYADLARHDAGLEPNVEIHSAWGTFEWMLDDAFSRGYRIGIVANSDGHKGRPGASYPGASTFGSYGGLTCVLAENLDRESVWDAYQKRRVYGTTGARILLNVTVNGDMMGSEVDLSGERPYLDVEVCGTAPIERVEIRNGMRVIKTFRTYSDRGVGSARIAVGSRVKVLWQGAEVRGRGRQVTWDGHFTLKGNRIKGITPINFHNQEKQCVLVNDRRCEWQSITTGGVSGVILDLEKPSKGVLAIETSQRSMKVSLRDLGLNGKAADCGGLEKRLKVYPLPISSEELAREDGESYNAPNWLERTDFWCSHPIQPKYLQKGDNPLYVCVVQEDGHMAWSSPIYCRW